jgi:hypothetical protein
MKRKTKLLIVVGLTLLITMSSCGPWWDEFGPEPSHHEMPGGGPGGHGGGYGGSGGRR